MSFLKTRASGQYLQKNYIDRGAAEYTLSMFLHLLGRRWHCDTFTMTMLLKFHQAAPTWILAAWKLTL
jgi:hypothetical protein